MKRILLSLLAAVSLVGCSMANTQTGLAASGQSLIGVGTQFVSVANVYGVQCKPPAVPAGDILKFCTAFRDFGPRFQATYPVAVQAWKTAVKANDTAAAQGAEAAILTLATDLSALALQAASAVGGK